jgi:hypothetical protein
MFSSLHPSTTRALTASLSGLPDATDLRKYSAIARQSLCSIAGVIAVPIGLVGSGHRDGVHLGVFKGPPPLFAPGDPFPGKAARKINAATDPTAAQTGMITTSETPAVQTTASPMIIAASSMPPIKGTLMRKAIGAPRTV